MISSEAPPFDTKLSTFLSLPPPPAPGVIPGSRRPLGSPWGSCGWGTRVELCRERPPGVRGTSESRRLMEAKLLVETEASEEEISIRSVISCKKHSLGTNSEIH